MGNSFAIIPGVNRNDAPWGSIADPQGWLSGEKLTRISLVAMHRRTELGAEQVSQKVSNTNLGRITHD